MATELVKSVALTNRDATPQKPVDLRLAGRSFNKRGRVTVGVADTLSVYGFFSIPSNAVIDSVSLSCDQGTAGTMDFGLYKTTRDGGGFGVTQAIANSKNCFAAAVDMHTAALVKKQLLWSTLFSVANAEKRVWEALGLSADPMVDYDVCGTSNTAFTTAAFNALLEMSYKLV